MKKILLLGSGLMSETVVQYLNKRKENLIMIASNEFKEAEKISKKFERVQPYSLDVTNPKELDNLVSQADIVISYIPWIFHKHVADSCLRNNKNMVTASYISPALKSLDKEVQKKGLLFLNEVGVDPGIDHIATMKVIHDCNERGDKIVGYQSMCGGLPSPEFCDNPMGYKFSWSPLGAFLALKNDAKFIQNGKVVEILGDQLQYHAKPIEINMAFSLEGYPNRDSTQYKQLYNLKDVDYLMRGTLRFQGFSLLINSYKSLGLMDNENKVGNQVKTWPELLKFILSKDQSNPKEYTNIFNSLGIAETDPQLNFYSHILKRSLSHPFYQKKSKQEQEKMGNKILEAIIKLGFLDSSNTILPDKTYLENLVKLLEKQLSLKPGETDLLVMQHIFNVVQKNGNKYTIKSSLIKIGEKNGYSAMSVLVGYPTAIATQLILDGKIKITGVQMPNQKEIYLPLYEELQKNGIQCVEEYFGYKGPLPKL